MEKKKKIIVVVGPTASGKSGLAHKIAEKFGGYLISADSRMVYKGMDIGTNKDKGKWVRKGTRKVFVVDGIEEYLIDVVKPGEEFTVEDWIREVNKVIKQKGDSLPVIVGGTGLYTTALTENYEFGSDNKRLQKKIQKDLATYGLHYLVKELIKLDHEIDQKIDIENPRRVARALEMLLESKKARKQESKKTRKQESNYEYLQIGKSLPREELYKNIDGRVDQLVAEGVLDEAKKFYKLSLDPSSPAITGIGYRQFFPYFEEKISLDEALRLLKRDTRHYAKRQLTWYRKYGKRVEWVSGYEEAEQLVEKYLG